MCAAMVGADPDALDRLADSFDQQAQALDTTAHRVRAQVHANPWRGGAANRFRADWDSTHMPRLRQTSGALRSSAKVLRQQAADQRNASGHASGSTGSPGLSHHLPRETSSPSDPYGAVRDFMKELRAQRGEVAGLDLWGALGAATNLAEVMGHKIPGLGTVLHGIGFADLVDRTFRGDANWWEWTSEGGSMVTEAGKAGRNPALWLGGIAIQSWSNVAEEASKADFSSEGWNLVVGEVTRNPGIVIEEFGNAAAQTMTKFVSWL